MRVKMIVAYDGTNYCGWQIQPNGITIEQVLNEHLSRLLKEDIKVTGASRTDAGVHSLDTEKMSEAAKYLIGEHDFASFCSANSQAQTTVRTIYDCTVSKVGDIITIRVTGNGFLYNMVRIIAGTLVKIGGSDMPADAMNGIIAATDRAAAGPTAPAHGLTMIGLKYE